MKRQRRPEARKKQTGCVPSDLVDGAHQSFTRLARCVSQLMREQLSCGPVTLQQCYTLQALADGPMSMKRLATDVAFHQSTLTRIVEKLEKQGLVKRTRSVSDQRTVEVELTSGGRSTYAVLEGESKRMVSALLEEIPEEKRASTIEALETLAHLLDPSGAAFQTLRRGCCSGAFEGERT